MMKLPRALLAPLFLFATSHVAGSASLPSTTDSLRQPQRYFSTVAKVFRGRGYKPDVARSLAQDKPIYVLGNDAKSAEAFDYLRRTKGFLPLSLNNPNHAFSYQFNGACFVKLTEAVPDRRAFISAWTGIAAKDIENDDVDVAAQELGMAFHEVTHCAQDESAPSAVKENGADLAFLKAEPFVRDPHFLRDTIYFRSLLMLNQGFAQDRYIFGPLPTRYVAALLLDAHINGQPMPSEELAEQAYNDLKSRIVEIMSYQTQLRDGFPPGAAMQDKVAMAVDTYLKAAKQEPQPQAEAERLSLRAAELYWAGLAHFSPTYARTISTKSNVIDQKAYLAFSQPLVMP